MEKRSTVSMACAIKFSEYNATRKCWFEVTETGETVFYTNEPSLLYIPADAGNWHYSGTEKGFISNDGLKITVLPCTF